jgi:phosphoribosylformimino-5-aminoimidazole carboxamide ribonucleotide (ProFAR) isomerase
MQFCPCIDLHHGQVKQIVGSTLQDQLVVDDKGGAISNKKHRLKISRWVVQQQLMYIMVLKVLWTDAEWG